MTKLERLQNTLSELKAQYTEAYRKGQHTKLPRLEMKIADVEDQIREARFYEPAPLERFMSAEEFRRLRLPQKILAVFLASDFLADCAYDLKDTLSRKGLVNSSLMEKIDGVCRQSQHFANFACHLRYGEQLGELMVHNGRLVDDMHTLMNLFINQNLKVT